MHIFNQANGNEYTNPKFKVEASRSPACVCDCCHIIDYVYKIDFPDTSYRGAKRKLSVKRKHLWICRDCMQKLYVAIGRASDKMPSKTFADCLETV